MKEIVFMLASMYLTSRSTSQIDDDFPAAVVSAAKELSDFEGVDVDWTRAKSLLAELLACEGSLGITAKAIGVSSEYEKTFGRARILTDMRPIFSESVDDHPAAAVVVHTLRITYFTPQGGDGPSAFYLALDATDLIELQKQISRALAKEQSISKALAAINLPVLSPQEGV